MGVTVPNQPPQIRWPEAGAIDVPTDAWLFGTGGTLERGGAPTARPLPASIALVVDGTKVGATWEQVGTFIIGPTPLGLENHPVICVRPDAPLAPNADVRLVQEDGAREQVIAAFRTGTGPSVGPSPSPVRLPASDPRVSSVPLPPLPGSTRPMRTIGLELPPGPFLVDVGPETHLVVGPGLHVQQAAQGERVRVRDARLSERLAFTAE
jgi:hypothetical protein